MNFCELIFNFLKANILCGFANNRNDTKKGMIVLKYTEDSNSRKKAVNTGLYVIIGLCLLLIGGASWFALRATNGPDTKPEISSSNSEYSNPSTSYNQSVMEPPAVSSEPVAEKVSDEPYSSETEKTVEEKPKAVVFAMPVQGDIIKKHSDTELQYSATYSDMRLHLGVDIACKKGTAVSACSDGNVISIELNTTNGNVVTIEHGNSITVKYASLEDIKVKTGDSVEAGDIIGKVGTVPSECEDKEHLHLEVYKNGKSVEPLMALGLE